MSTTQPQPELKTLDMAKVKELSKVIETTLNKWAEDNHQQVSGAEMGHAMLMFMFECGRQAGLDATIIMAIASPQQPQPSTPVAEA